MFQTFQRDFVLSSIGTARPQLYPAPSSHGDLELTGLRGWVARRPLAGFLVIVLGLSWLLFAIPVLAFHGVIPGANLPVEVFALASTLLIMLPTALWVTSIIDGRAGVRALFAPGVSLAVRHWLVVGGAAWPTSDRAVARLDLRRLAAYSGSRTGVDQTTRLDRAGRRGDQSVGGNGVGRFFQTRLEARFNFIVAAALTALPFAGVHIPLLLLDDQMSAHSVLKGTAGLLILGIVIRLLMGVMLRAALDSVLAVGILHQIFDASNNNGALVDSLLDGTDAGNMTQLAAVVLTVLVAAWLLWRRPGAFAKRYMPLRDASREVG
jgi:uncharacterized protein